MSKSRKISRRDTDTVKMEMKEIGFIMSSYYDDILYSFLNTDILREYDPELIKNYVIRCAIDLFSSYSKKISKDESYNIHLAVACTILAFNTITQYDWAYGGMTWRELVKGTGLDSEFISELEEKLMRSTDYKSCRKVLSRIEEKKDYEDDYFLTQEIPEHLRPKHISVLNYRDRANLLPELSGSDWS